MTKIIEPTRNLTTACSAQMDVTFHLMNCVTLNTRGYIWDRDCLKELITFLKEVRKDLPKDSE